MKILTAMLCLALAIPAAATTLAIRAGAVIDPEHGSVARNQVVLVEDGRIKAIAADVAIPAGATVIDLSHEWLMPGLMDAHTHLTLTEVIGGDAPFESFYIKESTAYRTLRGLRNAGDLLAAGFTTVRAIDTGMFPGPTIISCGKIIAPFGGQSHSIPAEQGRFWSYEYLDADGPDAIRKAVRQNLYYGARAIKLVLDNNPYHYSVEELRAAIEEAHAAGVPVSVHVYGCGARTASASSWSSAATPSARLRAARAPT